MSAIERSSRCEIRGQSVKPLIDLEILAGYADLDEITHESSIGTYGGRTRFLRADDVPDEHVAHSEDSTECLHPAEQIHDDECECRDGKVCIKCCTKMDLMGLPPSLRYEVANHRFGGRGEVCDVIVSIEVAEWFRLMADK